MCVCARLPPPPSQICAKTCTVSEGENAGQCERHVFICSLSCECFMFPINMPLPNKGAPVLAARARAAPRRPGTNAVPFLAGTTHQEFSSADTAAGLIPIQSICTGIAAAGEESVCWNEVGRLHSERLNDWWRASHWLDLDTHEMVQSYMYDKTI